MRRIDRNSLTEKDPTGLAAMVTAAVEAALVVLHVATDEADAIVQLVAAVMPLVALLWVRGRAWAPATVAKLTPADVDTNPAMLPSVPPPGPPAA